MELLSVSPSRDGKKTDVARILKRPTLTRDDVVQSNYAATLRIQLAVKWFKLCGYWVAIYFYGCSCCIGVQMPKCSSICVEISVLYVK